MSATSTRRISVQTWGFEDICLLAHSSCLTCRFCSSDQRFACGFLRIPPHDGHPCRPPNSSPCRACIGLQPTSQCALPGAQTRKANGKPFAFLFQPQRVRRRLAEHYFRRNVFTPGLRGTTQKFCKTHSQCLFGLKSMILAGLFGLFTGTALRPCQTALCRP